MDDFSKLEVIEVTTDEWRKQAISAFEHWITQSNGKLEARKFFLKPAIENTDIWKPEFLAKLNLSCLDGAVLHKVNISKELDADDFLLQFKSAAGFGGAYGGKPSDELFDKAVRKSLAALTEVSESQTISNLRSSLDAYFLYEFDAESKWFYQVAWDFGFMILDMDGRKLSVIAATDTD